MPRVPRLHVDGGFYHVILRGNHRQQIFFRPEDRDRFGTLLAEVIDRFRMRVHDVTNRTGYNLLRYSG